MAGASNIYLNQLGIVNAMGIGGEQVLENLLMGRSAGMHTITSALNHQPYFVGEVTSKLPAIPARLKHLSCKNNQLILAALKEIEGAIESACERYSPERLGVVMGSSTSGVVETEKAFFIQKKSGKYPADYHYVKQTIGSVADFVAEYCSLTGPAYGISTACSSSGKVLASARALIESGLCDAVLVGGADSLCDLTLQGFSSLEAIDSNVCNPFSVNRKGINIGEAAAIFLMSREPEGVALAGVGESSDAYHMSAPEPSGSGAEAAMRAALSDADLEPEDIGYINLHGTGTKLNDEMESHGVYSIFQDKVLASSTKPLTGHTLGAAGATEAGLCWLLLMCQNNKAVAPHLFDGELDPALSKINLHSNNEASSKIKFMMSNSFAFGGNNVSVILGKNDA